MKNSNSKEINDSKALKSYLNDKKIRNSKEFLSKAYLIDKRINNKIELILRLRELAMKTNSVLSDMPPNATRNFKQRDELTESDLRTILGRESAYVMLKFKKPCDNTFPSNGQRHFCEVSSVSGSLKYWDSRGNGSELELQEENVNGKVWIRHKVLDLYVVGYYGLVA
jgi:hypothetical protein